MRENAWLRLFCPHLYLASVQALPLADLKRHGLRGLVFDLDNTLLNWNVCDVSPQTKSLFDRLKAEGFRSCLVSNNKKDRVEVVARVLDVPAISKAGKPRSRAFRQAMAVLGTSAAETAVVGDQLFTDILGGNRLGLFTILVVPLSRREFVGTRLMRCLERSVLRLLAQRGLLQNPANPSSSGRN
ncbi:YqeG family HAD IIIA-type phosphatase [Gelria sp. Kuro-4]|uniref:YqeG family HAD IIIA-type phosphatase n=1 Tax=Gelria sp. Kuro-4 TaxID=2796927 RepID=UPI001BF1131D|nr:YqeG family HAD IIIA-type phosphatase [Gelria sp. Kuro-4]MDI3522960.1 putative phosphatase [Bacillota bacterium]BCV25140.1 haloacid dehalogenase [Gelria sp. Kuro-4]